MKANTFHTRFRAGKALHQVWRPQPPQLQERPNAQSGACVHCCVHTHTLPSPTPTFTHARTRAAWPQAQSARVTGQVMGVPVPRDGRSPRAERTAEQGLSVGRTAGTRPAWGGETECLQLVDGDIFAFLSWESTALVLRTDEEEEGWGERRLLRSQRYALSSTLEPRRVTRPLEEPHVQHG